MDNYYFFDFFLFHCQEYCAGTDATVVLSGLLGTDTIVLTQFQVSDDSVVAIFVPLVGIIYRDPLRQCFPSHEIPLFQGQI